MPILRAWELGTPVDIATTLRIFRFATLMGVAAAVLALAGAGMLAVPGNPGTLVDRLLTIPFASVVTEIVAHLLVLSVVVLWLKSRWVAILLSSVAFTLVFHGQAIGPLSVTLYALAVNFFFATLTGWAYIRHGFVCAMLTHAVAHGIVLGVN